MVLNLNSVSITLRRWLGIERKTEMEYWQERAARYGRRAVLNVAHPEEEFDLVTENQKREIFPHLSSLLRGDERIIVDFGCGPGRFSADLAALIAGKAIGLDPVPHFLDLAVKSQNVEFRKMTEGVIPLTDRSVDVVWACLVLGGIVKPQMLAQTVGENAACSQK